MIDGLDSRDFYEILEVGHDASPEEIKKSYRRLAKKYHPDVSADPRHVEKFHEIQKAYEVLSDAEMRKFYDDNGFVVQSTISVRDEAIQTIQGWILQVIEDGHMFDDSMRFKFRDFMLDTINNTRRNISEDIAKLKKKELRAQNFLKRIRSEELSALAEESMKRYKIGQAQMQRGIAVADECKAIIDGVEYEIDLPEDREREQELREHKERVDSDFSTGFSKILRMMRMGGRYGI